MRFKHQLVSVGDSLTQGFKSGAIFESNLSYPAIIAWEMGLGANEFRYAPFTGAGGLPINIEYLLRRLDQSFGQDVDWYELPLAGMYLREWMDGIEDYWERGPGIQPLGYSGLYHNLAVWGFEIGDAYQVTAAMCKEALAASSDDWFNQVPQMAMLRTALRVLNPSHSADPADAGATQISRVEQLAMDGGIENLIVFLGANNVLGTVTSLKYIASTQKDMDEPNPTLRTAKIYTPEHYDILMGKLADEVERVSGGGTHVRRVFWGTVPPVTIPPVTRGVGGRLDSADDLGESPYGPDDDPKWYRRYFKYYTRPWIPDKKFRPTEDPYLKGRQIVRIDRTIAAYNRILNKRVAAHNNKQRAEGKEADWFVVDLHQTLERLAFRRYFEDPSVPPPPGWTPYELPGAYQELNLTTQFLAAKDGQRTAGGLFSLDGIHPTTVAYGIVAQEFINEMQKQGAQFMLGDGNTIRTGPVRVDYRRLIKLDSLMKSLPKTLDDLWEKTVDGDQLLDLFDRAIRWLK
jgi:hypothetical protein